MEIIWKGSGRCLVWLTSTVFFFFMSELNYVFMSKETITVMESLYCFLKRNYKEIFKLSE